VNWTLVGEYAFPLGDCNLLGGGSAFLVGEGVGEGAFFVVGQGVAFPSDCARSFSNYGVVLPPSPFPVNEAPTSSYEDPTSLSPVAGNPLAGACWAADLLGVWQQQRKYHSFASPALVFHPLLSFELHLQTTYAARSQQMMMHNWIPLLLLLPLPRSEDL
jgi:hypothetical protein